MLDTTQYMNTYDRIEMEKSKDASVALRYLTVPTPVFVPPIKTQFTMPYATPVFQRKYEVIKTDNKRVGNTWKPCQHYRQLVGLQGYPDIRMPWITPSSTGIGYYAGNDGVSILALVDSPQFVATFGKFGRHNSGLPVLIQTDVGDGFVPKPAELTSLNDMAIKAMLTLIKPELSLINSIIELKDFKSLPKTLHSLTSFVGSLASSVKKTTKLSANNKLIRNTFSRSTPTMSEALGVSADSYLQWSFNILPLLSDIAGVQRAILRTQRRINDLVVRQGKKQRKHFTKVYPLPTSRYYAADSSTSLHNLTTGQFAGLYDPPGFCGCYCTPARSFRFTREVTPGQVASFHAEVDYYFNFSRFQTENAQLLGHLDALGCNLNPSIIWNAIPWTFVVDWVFGISKWLNERQVLNMEPAIHVLRYLWSWETTRVTRMKVQTFNGPSNLGYQFNSYLPDLVETVYRRDIGVPTLSSMLSLSGLSPKELSLGVALAITQRRRLKPRGR